jgi:hypothetical protein
MGVLLSTLGGLLMALIDPDGTLMCRGGRPPQKKAIGTCRAGNLHGAPALFHAMPGRPEPQLHQSSFCVRPRLPQFLRGAEMAGAEGAARETCPRRGMHPSLQSHGDRRPLFTAGLHQPLLLCPLRTQTGQCWLSWQPRDRAAQGY